MNYRLSQEPPVSCVDGSFSHFLVEDLVEELRVVQVTSPVVERKGRRLAHWRLRYFLVRYRTFVIVVRVSLLG